MSFGRRLALFFLLIALVPTLALLAMLVLVNEDSRRGKADARLASGLETAVALYEEKRADARAAAEPLADDPSLGAALASGDPAGLRAFADRAVRDRGLAAVEVVGPADAPLAEGGAGDAIAFSELVLTSGGEPRGRLRVSTETADEYASELRRLTNRELVLSSEGETLTATISPPGEQVPRGETADVEAAGNEYRAREIELADGETLLLLGPRKEGGFLTIDRPAAVLLFGFLALGMLFAYALARTLTGLHAQVAEQAATDPLTGLCNRRRMEQLLDREVARAERFGHRISLLIVDIDDFKATNDRFGHPAGDAVLREIADVIRANTRSIDVGARYGGDELALILLETDVEGARVLAERLRSQISSVEIPVHGHGPFRATVSIGAATIPDSADDARGLVQAADQALLRAKRAGKNKLRTAPKRAKDKVGARG